MFKILVEKIAHGDLTQGQLDDHCGREIADGLLEIGYTEKYSAFAPQTGNLKIRLTNGQLDIEITCGRSIGPYTEWKTRPHHSE